MYLGSLQGGNVKISSSAGIPNCYAGNDFKSAHSSSFRDPKGANKKETLVQSVTFVNMCRSGSTSLTAVVFIFSSACITTQ